MKLTSPAFKHNEPIPSRYTGEGANISPPLEWSNVPPGCKEFALVCEDPDAPIRAGSDHPFVHWVIYGIPASTTLFPEGKAQGEQGKNSFGKIGYGGPMPPSGHGTHHYHFKLYALGSTPGLRPGLTERELLKEIQGSILAEAKLTGTYERELPHIVVRA